MILLLDIALLALIPIAAILLIKALVETAIGIIQIILGLILLGCSYLLDALVWPFRALKTQQFA